MAKKKIFNKHDAIIKDIDPTLINSSTSADIYTGDLPHRVSYGKSKVVIIFDDLDVVYKVHMFKNTDFQERNEKIFNVLKCTDLKPLFPEQIFCRKKNGFEIYTQDKCEQLGHIRVSEALEIFKNTYTYDIYDFVFNSGYVTDSLNFNNFGYINDLPVIFDFDISDNGLIYLQDNLPVYTKGVCIKNKE